MEFFIGWIMGMVLMTIIGFANSRESQVKSDIIKTQGFCIEAEKSGINFKKCYELKEKAE